MLWQGFSGQRGGHNPPDKRKIKEIQYFDKVVLGNDVGTIPPNKWKNNGKAML